MNARADKTLREKLQTLPPARLAAVEDFVDFLRSREVDPHVPRTAQVAEPAFSAESFFEKLEALPPQQRAEVEDFVDFLTAKAKKRAALDRLLANAPALEAAGAEPMSDEEIVAEVKAARAERRARKQRETK